MKKKKLALLLSLSMLISILSSGCFSKSESDSSVGGSEYQKIELVMAVNGTDIQIDSLVANKFAKLVEEESGGDVTIAVYPNDQLAGGNATKGIEMIAGGSVDLAAYATCTMAVIDGQLAAATIPWIFDDYTDARTVIDETGGEYYAERLSQKRITYLGSFHNGFRQVTNNKRAIEAPEDLKGLKIRVPGSEVFMSFFRTLEADPVAMSWSEVFTAIQQYMTLWNYSYENNLFVANTEVWKSLDQKTRDLLQEKAAEACEWGRDQVEAEEVQLVQEFRDAGVEVTELTQGQLDGFKEVMQNTRQGFIDKYGEGASKAFQVE